MFLLPFYNFDEDPTPPFKQNGWKFFIACEDENGEESDFLDALEGIGENCQADFGVWIHQLTKFAALGKPWETLLDKKTLHDLGEITIRHTNGSVSNEKVWQFRHKTLRLMWCYGGEGRVILLGHVMRKDQNKMDPTDKAIVESVMNKYTNACEEGEIKIAGGKENEQTFGPLFSTSKKGPNVRKKNAPSRNRR